MFKITYHIIIFIKSVHNCEIKKLMNDSLANVSIFPVLFSCIELNINLVALKQKLAIIHE